MTHSSRTINWRTAACIAGAALLGAAWALFNLSRAGGSGFTGSTAQLVWAVFATPFFTFWGWLIARRQERWLAALVCFSIYFFAAFVGARLELLVLGLDAAEASGHALYYQLTLSVQLIACLVVAAQRSTQHGTMKASTDS